MPYKFNPLTGKLDYYAEAPTAAGLSVDDLITLSGVAEGETDLGVFTGVTVPDDQTIKAALQAVETAVEAAAGKEIVQAATDVLTSSKCKGQKISNYGQAVANTQTLPAAAADLSGSIVIATAGTGAFHLKAGAGDKLYLDGVALDDGDKASLAAPAIGDCFSFFSIKTGASAYDWVVLSAVGALTDGGA